MSDIFDHELDAWESLSQDRDDEYRPRRESWYGYQKSLQAQFRTALNKQKRLREAAKLKLKAQNDNLDSV